MTEEQTPLLGASRSRRISKVGLACLATILVLFALSALYWQRPVTQKLVLKAASLNIRYDPTPHRQRDTEPGGEHSWDERRPGIVSQLQWEQPDLFGLQEVLSHQFDDLRDALKEPYESVGVGRDDGDRAGEAVPIFWHRDVFSLNKVSHFWLSKTPDVPGSKDWDAGQTRMATHVMLQHRSTRRVVHAISTHFDDQGPLSRGKAARVVLKRLKRVIEGSDLVILLGDLNSEAHETGYQVLTNHRYDNAKGASKHAAFLDTRQESLARPYGNNGTFTDFRPPGKERESIIDFVLMNDAPRWQVSRVAILPNLFSGDGIRLSDHRMVLAVLEMR